MPSQEVTDEPIVLVVFQSRRTFSVCVLPVKVRKGGFPQFWTFLNSDYPSKFVILTVRAFVKSEILSVAQKFSRILKAPKREKPAGFVF